jgi:hypothetical protein
MEYIYRIKWNLHTSSPQCYLLVFLKVRNVTQRMYVLRHLVFKIHTSSKWVIYFSAEFSPRYTVHWLCVLKAHNRGQLWSNDHAIHMWWILWHGLKPLVPATNSLAGTAAGEYALCYPAQCHPDANVFQQLEQDLSETGSATPVAHMNAGCPQTVCTPANEDAEIVTGTRAMEKLMQYHTRTGDSPKQGSSK